MKKTTKILLVMLMASVLMLSVASTVSATASTTNPEKTDNNAKIESKEKTVKYKIKWDANGGKIGTKKIVTTTVKKGSKLNKLPTTPKRSSYTFRGWYTKKTGGTKINKNTKPKKSVTYYAKWSKGTTADSKLVGRWSNTFINFFMGRTFTHFTFFSFKADGTFIYTSENDEKRGNYKVSNSGEVTLTNIAEYELNGPKTGKYPNTVAKYRIIKSSDGADILHISKLYTPENLGSSKTQYLDIPASNNVGINAVWHKQK